jgi:hypothetical protein
MILQQFIYPTKLISVFKHFIHRHVQNVCYSDPDVVILKPPEDIFTDVISVILMQNITSEFFRGKALYQLYFLTPVLGDISLLLLVCISVTGYVLH